MPGPDDASPDDLDVLRERDALRAKLLGQLLEESRRRREAEQELRVANDRMREAIRFKNDMLSVLAHEMGNPISPILIQLQLFQMGSAQLDARQKRALGIIESSVERLQDLVGDVLDVARMESGKLQLTRSPIDLTDLMREHAKPFEAVAHQAGVDLRLDLQAPAVVLADPRRLGQVVGNLLSNAVKFSPSGGTVTLSTEHWADGVRIMVQDQGLGLSREQIARLFQPFSRVHEGTASRIKGTGLGLYICRNLVAAHDGRIWAESEGPGKGSRFLIHLPRHDSQ